MVKEKHRQTFYIHFNFVQCVYNVIHSTTTATTTEKDEHKMFLCLHHQEWATSSYLITHLNISWPLLLLIKKAQNNVCMCTTKQTEKKTKKKKKNKIISIKPRTAHCNGNKFTARIANKAEGNQTRGEKRRE